MTEKTYDPCVAICLPVADKLTLQFFRSYNRLYKPSSASEKFGHRGATHTIDALGYPIEKARNILTAQALAAEPRVGHVLWIDDDMEFPPHALERLLGHDLPVVGGLCHNRRPPFAPILMKHHRNREGLGFAYHYPRGQLFEVDATGAAFLLVRRDVFEALSDAYGEGTWWDPLRGISEDFSFCEKVRGLGIKIHVDCGLEIGHVLGGQVVVYSGFAERNRDFQVERWSPEPEMAREGAPVASVVVPSYNQDPRYLKAAVLSAAYQTVPVEVIIVDDGSDPPVPQGGWPENVRVVHHERDALPDNRGIAAALNTGVAHMTTNWFCWLSSDDLLDPRKVETQLALLHNTGGKLSFHRYQVFQDGSEGFAQFSEMPSWANLDEQRAVLSRGCAINGSTVMVHKSVFDEVGLFNPEYRYGQDWEFFCRAGERHMWYGHPEILGSRRDSPTNLTAQIDKQETPEALAKRRRRDAEDAAIRARYAWPKLSFTPHSESKP